MVISFKENILNFELTIFYPTIEYYDSIKNNTIPCCMSDHSSIIHHLVGGEHLPMGFDYDSNLILFDFNRAIVQVFDQEQLMKNELIMTAKIEVPFNKFFNCEIKTEDKYEEVTVINEELVELVVTNESNVNFPKHIQLGLWFMFGLISILICLTFVISIRKWQMNKSNKPENDDITYSILSIISSGHKPNETEPFRLNSESSD